jgi:hypothetical protein
MERNAVADPRQVKHPFASDFKYLSLVRFEPIFMRAVYTNYTTRPGP